jgi:hypothetical protein
MIEKFVGIKCSFCVHECKCKKETSQEIKDCKMYISNTKSIQFNPIFIRVNEETNSLEMEWKTGCGDGIYLVED